jgi:hypothetical protein
MPEKILLPISPSVLFIVPCIDETASNFIPFIAIFNLVHKNGQPALNQGSRVDEITQDPMFRQKLGHNP